MALSAGNGSAIKVCLSMAYVVQEPTTLYINNSIAGCVVNACFAVIGTVLNFSVVYIFCQSKKLTTKIAFFLIMVLSIIDLFAACIVHTLYILNSVSEITGAANCTYKLVYQVSQLLLSGQSAMTLVTLNIERYLSILHPVFHRNRVTKRRCVAGLFMLSLIPFTLALSRLFNSNIQTVVAGVTVIICLVSSYTYIAIFCTVVRKKWTMPNVRKQKSIFLKEVRLAKTCFCIVACCFMLYLPNAVTLAIRTEQTRKLDVLTQIKVWTSSLVTINSTMNSFVFVWANREFRQALKLIKIGKRPALTSLT